MTLVGFALIFHLPSLTCSISSDSLGPGGAEASSPPLQPPLLAVLSILGLRPGSSFSTT